jgi:hypothetical protein
MNAGEAAIMPDNMHDLQHDIALLGRAIECGAETLASGLFSMAEFQAIREGIARLKHDITALNRRLELVR